MPPIGIRRQGTLPWICTILLLLLLLPCPARAFPGAFASPPDSDRAVLQAGEELTYNVSYASVNLGQIRIRVLEKKTMEGTTAYTAQANIDSYRGVPFVDLHAIYDNVIDERVHSRWFRSRMRGDNGWDTVIYSFDYPGRKLFIRTRPAPGDGKSSDDTLGVEGFCQDGLSLFFFARHEIARRHTITVPTVVNEKKGTTSFDFTAARSGEEIDAVDYPVDVVYFRGEAGFVGVFGLSGEFEGWFSNDAAGVPILAKMKVLIGNIRIELMQWNRAGWAPPRYHTEGDD